MSALLINETFLNTFLRTQKSGFALKSVFLSEFALLRAFLSAQKSTQGPTQPLCDDEWEDEVQVNVNWASAWMRRMTLQECRVAQPA